MTYRIDPELSLMLPSIPEVDLSDLVGTRERSRQARLAQADVDISEVTITEVVVPGIEADPGVPIRLYRPVVQKPISPAILHVHGGGFVLGDLETSHRRCVELVQELNVVIASVDYRLAPEHPYPAARRDVTAALHWLAVSADNLSIDRTRIAIHGISAGAGLATGVALWMRDHDGPHLCFQFLSIPELDDRLDSPSMAEFTDTPVWNTMNARLSWIAYLGDGFPGSSDVDQYAAPARAKTLAGLPPAYVSVMEFDPLRDEGIAYAQALSRAGVPTELHLFPGTFHGSSKIAGAEVTRREAEEEIAVLRRALSHDERCQIQGRR